MIRERTESPRRACAFAAALLAITLNFFQPLIHAALMRDGMPAALWTDLCTSAAGDSDGQSGPIHGPADGIHECCLGLAHAAVVPLPSVAFGLVEVPRASEAVPLSTQRVAVVGIRDGPPHQRGPPTPIDA